MLRVLKVVETLALISFPVTIPKVLIGTNVIIKIITEILVLLLAIIYEAIIMCQTLWWKTFDKYDFIHLAFISCCLLFLFIWHFGPILFDLWEWSTDILLIPHAGLHTPGPQAQHTQTLRTFLLMNVNRQTVWGPKLRMEKSKGRGLHA